MQYFPACKYCKAEAAAAESATASGPAVTVAATAAASATVAASAAAEAAKNRKGQRPQKISFVLNKYCYTFGKVSRYEYILNANIVLTNIVC